MPTAIEHAVKTRCIGLTGGIASGKSTVAQMLRNKGYTVIDADQCARDVVAAGSPTLKKITDEFGAHLLGRDGSLDRDALRSLVLKDPNARARLEQITHPAIREAFAKAIEQAGLVQSNKFFFYEATLIHETKRANDFKSIWCTYCKKSTQMARLLHREHPKISPDQAEALIATQMPLAEKARLSSQVINTDVELSSVEQQIDDLLKGLS